MICRFFTVLLVLVIRSPVLCQTAVNDTTGEVAVANAQAAFLQAIQEQKEIYNGPEHIGYQRTIEGFAYFSSNEWQAGRVEYDGIAYSNEWLLYDLVKDKLVVKRPEGFPVEQRSEKIGWFTLSGRLFVYINKKENGLKPGFYEQLATGAILLLAKHQKRLEEQVDQTRIRQYFTEQPAYYAIKNNKTHLIRNLRSLLDLAGNQRGAIQHQLRKQGIKYKKNREAALVAAAAYFNQTQP